MTAHIGEKPSLRHAIMAVPLLGLVAGCVPATTPAPQPTPQPTTILGQPVNDTESVAIARSSGLPTEALLAMIALKSGRIALYLAPGTYSAEQAAAAPAAICKAKGKHLKDVAPIEPSHPGTFDGTDYLVFHCV